MSPAKRRHMYRQPNLSCVVGTSCLDGRTDIFEVTPACSFVVTVVPEICGQPPDIGTIPYLSEPTNSRLCRPEFYKGIQLESVEDHQWLGFTIDAPARTATFNLPKKPWQIRSPASCKRRILEVGRFQAFSPEQRSFANTLGLKSQYCRRYKPSRKSMYRQVLQGTAYLKRVMTERLPSRALSVLQPP